MKKLNRISIILLSLWLACIIAVSYYVIKIEKPAYEQEAEEKRVLFDTSEIVGRIKYVKQELFNGDAFVMENKPDVLYFSAIIFTDSDRGKQFRYVAISGDSIVKHKNSKELLLITKSKTYNCLVK